MKFEARSFPSEVRVNPDPTLIGPRNNRQQASEGTSQLPVPWFDNSPEVSLQTSDPNVCYRYIVWPRTARGLVILVGSGLRVPGVIDT